jgi:ribosome-associated toxin RatA of RatAB toxin-antitoxin module
MKALQVIAALLASVALGGTAFARNAVRTDVSRVGSLLEVRAEVEADASRETCYEVIADFDRLADFVPDMVSSRVVSPPGAPVRLRQVGQAGVGLFHVTIDVTLAVTVDAPRRIEFDRVDGNLAQMRGTWTVEGDAGHCALAYRAEIEPGFWVPPLIGPLLMQNQVEQQMRGLLAEILRRAGR